MSSKMFLFSSEFVSKKNKDGQMREQDYCSESHYRIVSPTFQYKMSHQRVGKCIIINNKNFDEKTGREETSNLNLVTRCRAVSFSPLTEGLHVLNRDECTQRYGSRRRRALQVLQDPWLWCLCLQWSDMWEDGTSPQRGWDRQVSMYLIATATHFFLNSHRDVLKYNHVLST